MWNALVAGFGGMRDYLGVWSFDPRLPRDWESLTYRMTLHGNRIRVHVLHDSITFALETGDAPEMDLVVQGRPVTVTRDAPLRVTLDPIRNLTGRPLLRDIAGSVRQDGSIIRTTVPDHPSLGDNFDVDLGPLQP